MQFLIDHGQSEDKSMTRVDEVMINKLKEHTTLSRKEVAALRTLPVALRSATSSDDLVRQGERPDVSMVVLTGMVARYHTLPSGARQYSSFHIAGDWPDAQALFIDKMDHSLSAIASKTTVGLIPHESLLALFERVPSIGFAVWRETLIDAAIFRETITNNSSRDVPARLAHFLCERYYRAQAAHLVKDNSCSLELSQEQVGETLGASLTTINRGMQVLRRKGAVDLRLGRLYVRNWAHLSELGEFDPSYLHLRRPLRVV
jgi:CRP-like cAMP-binding protein